MAKITWWIVIIRQSFYCHSFYCIVIVLINNPLLGGQQCTDYVDIWQRGNVVIGGDRLAITPRLNFTCDGRITSISARVWFEEENSKYPFFQVWRPESVGSTVYNKIDEIQLQLEDQLYVIDHNVRLATIILTDNNTVEFQSGDIVGYYHPFNARFRVITERTNGYRVYEFTGIHESVDLNNTFDNDNYFLQPLIQFTIGKCDFNY